MCMICKLMKPLAEGAGVIFVVDGSRPIRRAKRREAEILRLAGNPRMALINEKLGGEGFQEEWKKTLLKSFNSVHVFNAHQARYRERLALFEALKSIHQDWAPQMQQAIDAIQANRRQRRHRSSDIILYLLKTCIQQEVSVPLGENDNKATATLELAERYQKKISREESRAWQKIRKLYRHKKWRPDAEEFPVLREELFGEETLKSLGLSRKQKALAGARWVRWEAGRSTRRSADCPLAREPFSEA